MPGDKKPRPAYVVDVDENGKQVRGSARSAYKEKPKVSQQDDVPSRTRKSHSDTSVKDVEYARALQIVTEHDAKSERRKSINVNPNSPRKPTRPPLSHENRTSTKTSVPQRSPKDIPSNYGVQYPTQYAPHVSTAYAPPPGSHPMQIPLRPRAVTTQTLPVQQPAYHPAYGVNSGQAYPPAMPTYYPQATFVAPSYPPPSPNTSYMNYVASLQPATPQQDYFAQQIQQPSARPLAARFESIPRTQVHDPIARTVSAFGTRDTRRVSLDGHVEDDYHEDSYASRVSDGAVRKRDSIRAPVRRAKEQEDTRAMPPPPLPATRPGILRKHVAEQAPDKPDDGDRRDRKERSHLREKPLAHRPSTNRHSASYDYGKDSEQVRVETANNGRRRQSYYGQSVSMGTGTGYEDKLSSAANYQADVSGPTVPLTAELLKKQRRQGGSSRSVSSRDESDYKKSQTTRTTRSGSGNDDENVTIKVSGHARVMVGDTQIDCADGGEISISRQKSVRNGSERGSEFGGQRQIDDRRSRVERPAGRSRISSTHSYTRSSPQYQVDTYLS